MLALAIRGQPGIPGACPQEARKKIEESYPFDSYACSNRSVWIVSERKRGDRLQIPGPAASVWRRWHCAALAPGMRTEGTDNKATVAAVMKRGAEALLAFTG